jgi:hypothetical protein
MNINNYIEYLNVDGEIEKKILIAIKGKIHHPCMD